MCGSRTGGQMGFLSLQVENRTAGQGQRQSVWWMEETSADSSKTAAPVPALCLHSSAAEASGQPALRPSMQRPPMSAGLPFLPSLMLTFPCNIPQVSDAALPQEAAKPRWAPLLCCTSVLWGLSTVLLRLIWFTLSYSESHKHTSSPPSHSPRSMQTP